MGVWLHLYGRLRLPLAGLREIMLKIKVNKTYKVHHCRKGDFIVRIKKIGDEWIDAEIVDGEALYISDANKATGDKIAMRKSFCTFTELR